MYRGNLSWLRLGDRYTHSLQALGQPPSPQPRWSSLEGHAAFLDCAPVQRTACNITAWGGDLGKEGEGRGEQVAVSSSPLEGAPHASREGPQPLGAENLRPITGEMFVQSERRGGGWRGAEKGKRHRQDPTPSTRPGSIVVPTAQDGAQMVCKAHIQAHTQNQIPLLHRVVY